MTRPFIYYLSVVFIARLFLSSWILSHAPLVPWEPDSPGYYQLAYSILDKGSFQTAGKPEIFRTPGYPLFLAGIFKVLGNSLAVIVYVQVFLSCLGIFLVYKVAQWVWKDQRLAFITAIIYSLDPWSFQISLEIGPDTLFTVLVIAFAMAAVKVFSSRQTDVLHYVLMAIALAACTLTRPLTYYFILPLAVLLAVYSYQQKSFNVSLKRGFLFSLLVIIIYGLLLGSWTMRNYNQTGAAVFTSLTAEHMYWDYGGKILSLIHHSSFKEEGTRASQLALQQEKTSSKAMIDFCNRQAGRIIGGHPVLFMKVFLSGMFSTLWSPGTLFLRDHLAGHNNILREAIKWSGIGYLFFSYVGAIGGVIWITLKKNWSFPSFLLLILALYLIVLSSTPVGYYRFRVPVWPFICFFTGYAVLF